MLPIFTIDFKYHNDIKDKLIELINETETAMIDRISRSDWSSDIHLKEYWKFLLPYITKTIEPIIYEKFFFKGWDVSNYWFQQYEKGDEHEWHFHGSTMYNFVYYVEKPNDAPSTQIMMPITGQIMEPKVEEGQILVMPSIVRHRSAPNQSNGRKTIIAWNINIK